jgi:hypothetical protein
VFTLASAISLLLLVATAVLWVRNCSSGSGKLGVWAAAIQVVPAGQRPPEQPAQAGDQVYLSVMDLVGPGIATVKTEAIADDGTIRPMLLSSVRVKGLTASEIASRVVEAYRRAGVMYRAQVECMVIQPGWRLPYWCLAAALLVLPLAWIVSAAQRRRRKRLRAAGRCPQCGYDLRATPERCPECGCQLAGSRV